MQVTGENRLGFKCREPGGSNPRTGCIAHAENRLGCAGENRLGRAPRTGWVAQARTGCILVAENRLGFRWHIGFE